MDGHQLKFDLKDLKETLGNDDALSVLVVAELTKLGLQNDLKPEFMLGLVDDVVKAIREQTIKFRTGRDAYPPSNVNMLAVQISLPSVGKVGVTEFGTRVCV